MMHVMTLIRVGTISILVRDSIVTNISYFFPLQDDETLPYNDSTTKSLAAMRGACALTAIAEYRKKVCSGQLPVERIVKKNIPLCSAAFKYMFHTCRIPKMNQDGYKLYDPSLHRHCVVACGGQFFAMDFVDDEDDPLPIGMLEEGLQQCVDLAKEKPLMQLGIFTTGDRDEWAKNRELLIKVGGEDMENALAKLESGAALICLDETNPATLQDCIPTYWYGGTGSSMNRWFDKSIQILCQSNGKVAYMGEHSMVDGTPAAGVCDHINQLKYKQLSERPSENMGVPVIQDIFEKVMESVMESDEIKSSILKGEVVDAQKTILLVWHLAHC